MVETISQCSHKSDVDHDPHFLILRDATLTKLCYKLHESVHAMYILDRDTTLYIFCTKLCFIFVYVYIFFFVYLIDQGYNQRICLKLQVW